MRKKKKVYVFTAVLLITSIVIWNSWKGKGAVTESGFDGFTNDTEISSTNYKKNKNKYPQIFEMDLAGPGLTAWDYATGRGVNVAVLDDGANLNDKELKGNIKGIYNAITDSEEWGQVHNTATSHGTSCAKILGAVGNNKHLSAGVAYNVNLYIVKVGKDGLIYKNDTMKGIRWAAKKNCRIISISFGGSSPDVNEEKLINELYTRKDNSILFVASGGNENKEGYHYPASCKNVLSVSALKYKNGSYQTANTTYNDRIDIAAPGSTTSAATPYAAGVAALIFQANPSLTAKECADIITSTAMDAGSKGYDKRYGYGIIQPLAAVQKAKYGKSYIARKISGTSSYKKSYGVKPFTLNAKIAGSGVLSYKSSNTKVASVSVGGKVTIRGTGKAVIKVSVPKSGIYGSASKNITVNAAPKRPSLSVKNIKKKKLKISWKKDKRASGYEICTASNSKFKKQKRYFVKKSSSKKTVSRLKKNKKYWVRMRSYKTVGSRKIYSSYSKVKTIKIRK